MQAPNAPTQESSNKAADPITSQAKADDSSQLKASTQGTSGTSETKLPPQVASASNTPNPSATAPKYVMLDKNPSNSSAAGHTGGVKDVTEAVPASIGPQSWVHYAPLEADNLSSLLKQSMTRYTTILSSATSGDASSAPQLTAKGQAHVQSILSILLRYAKAVDTPRISPRAATDTKEASNGQSALSPAGTSQAANGSASATGANGTVASNQQEAKTGRDLDLSLSVMGIASDPFTAAQSADVSLIHQFYSKQGHHSEVVMGSSYMAIVGDFEKMLLQTEVLSLPSTLKFCRDFDLVPHIVNKAEVEECFRFSSDSRRSMSLAQFKTFLFNIARVGFHRPPHNIPLERCIVKLFDEHIGGDVRSRMSGFGQNSLPRLGSLDSPKNGNSSPTKKELAVGSKLSLIRLDVKQAEQVAANGGSASESNGQQASSGGSGGRLLKPV